MVWRTERRRSVLLSMSLITDHPLFSNSRLAKCKSKLIKVHGPSISREFRSPTDSCDGTNAPNRRPTPASNARSRASEVRDERRHRRAAGADQPETITCSALPGFGVPRMRVTELFPALYIAARTRTFAVFFLLIFWVTW